MADVLDLGSLLPTEYAAPDVQAALGGGLDAKCNPGAFPIGPGNATCNPGLVPIL
jgi:hypothetical protein